MKKNQVIVLTAGFPFGKGETFLETELPYLADGFDEVMLIPLSSVKEEQRKVPANCSVCPLPILLSFFQKILGLRYLFSKAVRIELNVIRKAYKRQLTKGILTTLLVSYARANRMAKELEVFIATDKNQIFYSYWCEDSAIALAILKQKYPTIKAVTRMHGWDVYFEVSSVNYLPFRHLIAEKLDWLFPISEKGKEYILKGWKFNDSSKIKVARLGVSAQRFMPSIPKEFLIVSCSNVIPLKRVALILAALKQITRPVKWTHFGDGPLLNQLKEEAKGTGFEFKGRVSNTAVLEHYKSHPTCLFINVSTSEGVPVSIMEAFSFGIPAIATDVGGNGEIVNEENGTLVPKDITAEELAEVIREYMEMGEEEYRRKREGAYGTWEREYNAEVNYGRFVRVLAEVAEGRGGR